MALTQGILKCLDEKQARMKNPLVLAYVGDTLYDLFIRTDLVKRSGAAVNRLHRSACDRVNAHTQALVADTLYPDLTEEEQGIYRRGRNAKSVTAPKNMDIQDYHKATGIEAVMGYLFLSGQYERIDKLFEKILVILGDLE